MQRKPLACVESLESRVLFNGTNPAYAPQANVRGESMQQWAADWWKWVTSFTVSQVPAQNQNPNFDPTGAQAFRGDVGNAFFLSSFIALSTTGGSSAVQRSATVPTGTPVFVPLSPIEYDNQDTATPEGTLPGNYTVQQLRDLAATQVAGQQTLSATVDRQPVSDLFSYRQISPEFSYTLPPQNNLLQTFGIDVSGVVSPAVADGYYAMLKPLSPGVHTIEYTSSAAATAVSAPFNLDIVYHVTVVPRGQYDANALAAASAAAGATSSVSHGAAHKDAVADWI